MTDLSTHPNRRRLALLVAGVAVMTQVAMPPSSAEDLGDRRQRITREIDRGQAELDQSSAQLNASIRGLQTAEMALDTARSTLAKTRGELAAAQAFDSQMQAELAQATAKLNRARKDLVRRRVSVREQESVLRQIAVNSYASGDPALLGLSMVLNTQDTEQLTSQLNSVRSVLDKEAVTLNRLEASRVMLEVQEKAFEKAEREVARKRMAAAENLERKALLESQAEDAEAQIQDLVAARSRAREVAAQARTEDLQNLSSLEEERQVVSELLRRRAEEARKRAEAAAAAEARAREAARKQAAAAARAEAREVAREAAKARQAARKAAEARDAARNADQARDAARKTARAHRAARRAAEARQDARREARQRARSHAPRPSRSSRSFELLDPVNGYLTSSYGMRFHPVYQRYSLHDGTDFGASCGTPIRAAASGTVVSMYYHSAYGNRIIMDNGYQRGVGLGTSYNHLSGFSTHVGQRVQRGEIIGFVGTTGASTGCHLHFMVFENGSTVNPMNWL